MTKKTKKTNKKKKPVVSKLEQPVIIITDVYLVKPSILERVKAFLKRTVQPLLKPFKIKHKRGSTRKRK